MGGGGAADAGSGGHSDTEVLAKLFQKHEGEHGVRHEADASWHQALRVGKERAGGRPGREDLGESPPREEAPPMEGASGRGPSLQEGVWSWSESLPRRAPLTL